jgi:hypothetical protein
MLPAAYSGRWLTRQWLLISCGSCIGVGALVQLVPGRDVLASQYPKLTDRVRSGSSISGGGVALLIALVLVGLTGLARAQSAGHDEPDSFRDCRKPSYRFSPGGSTEVPLTIRRNATCTFRYWTGGAIFNQRVVVKPRRGIFGRSGSTKAAYRAGGSLGDDYFEVQIDWETRGARVQTLLKVSVSIVDEIK